MSHIPSSAMKHAGPVHHDEPSKPSGAADTHAKRASGTDKGADGGIGKGAWIAIGSTLIAGAAAAIAVPLLKGRSVPVPSRRGKKAAPKKGKAGKTAEA